GKHPGRVAAHDRGKRCLAAGRKPRLPGVARIVHAERFPERLEHELVLDQGADRTRELTEQRIVQAARRIQADQRIDESVKAAALALILAELASIRRVQRHPLENESRIGIFRLLFGTAQPADGPMQSHPRNLGLAITQRAMPRLELCCIDGFHGAASSLQSVDYGGDGDVASCCAASACEPPKSATVCMSPAGTDLWPEEVRRSRSDERRVGNRGGPGGAATR